MSDKIPTGVVAAVIAVVVVVVLFVGWKYVFARNDSTQANIEHWKQVQQNAGASSGQQPAPPPGAPASAGRGSSGMAAAMMKLHNNQK